MKNEIEEIKAQLKNHEERLREIEAKPGTKSIENKEKQLSLREFLNEFNFKSENDKTLIIIKFYEEYAGSSEMSAKEIAEGFKDMREKIPKNISDNLYQLAKRSFIMEAKNKDKVNRWMLTNAGEKHLNKIRKNESK